MKFRPIPGEFLQPCEKQGTMTRMYYTTETYDDAHAPLEKDALVYLPWGYDANAEVSYPVLYLMHGGGGTSDEFFGGIEAKTALKTLMDNCIAAGYCKPMLVICPSYNVPGHEEARQQIAAANELTHRFPTEFVNDLLPAVSAQFRVIDDAKARAFSGFSMGGESTWSILAGAAKHVYTVMPLSGDYWAVALKGGKDHTAETVDALIERLKAQGVTPEDFRIMGFTGDKDIAYEAMDPMIYEMEKRTEWFRAADEPQEGSNLCYCLKENGWHTYDDCYEYLCLALPWLF